MCAPDDIIYKSPAAKQNSNIDRIMGCVCIFIMQILNYYIYHYIYEKKREYITGRECKSAEKYRRKGGFF